MKKVTKNARIANLESKLVVMQTQINSLIVSAHDSTKRLIALEPDNPFHGKFFEAEPKLKQLDQSVFDGLDAKWRFAMVSSVGIPFVYDYKPTGKRHFISDKNAQLMINLGKVMRIDEYDYDSTDWQNSLIEREKVELTGSDLCRAMLARGDKFVMCAVNEDSQEETMLDGFYAAIESAGKDDRFYGYPHYWNYVTPINEQGEPLTQSEAGL